MIITIAINGNWLIITYSSDMTVLDQLNWSKNVELYHHYPTEGAHFRHLSVLGQSFCKMCLYICFIHIELMA